MTRAQSPSTPRGSEGNIALEVVLLVPVMVLLTLFVLWAGRGGRTALLADLTAEEAVVAASICCLEDDPANAANEEMREIVAEDILTTRPGMEHLCIGGPQPSTAGDEGFVAERWMSIDDSPEVTGVGLLGVQFTCETDGAIAPLRAVFPTVEFHGQASEVVALPTAPAITIDDVEVEEGEVASVIVRLKASSTDTILLTYATQPGSLDQGFSATDDAAGWSGSDFPRSNGTVTIPPGELDATFFIGTIEDSIYEHDEVLHLNMGVASAPGLDPNELLRDDVVDITILNDDAPPELEVDPRAFTVDEGDTLSFDVEVSTASSSTTAVGLPIDFTTDFLDEADGSANAATQGLDYDLPVNSTVTIPVGQASVAISVPILADEIGEGPEKFTLRLKNPVNAGFKDPDSADGQHVIDVIVTITDGQPGVEVLQNCGDAQASTYAQACADEGKAVEFIVGLTRPLTEDDDPVKVEVWTEQQIPPPGTVSLSEPARQGTSTDTTRDYTEEIPTTLTFTQPDPGMAATNQTFPISVSTVDDALHEGESELFHLRLDSRSSNSWVRTPTAVGAILDNDDAPTLSITGPGLPSEEGDPLLFTLELNAPSGRKVEARLVTRNGSADGDTDICSDSGDDFVSIPQSGPNAKTLEFPVKEDTGQTALTREVSIETCDDNWDEVHAETMELVAFNPQGAQFAGGVAEISAAGEIADNDNAVMSITARSASEPNSPGDSSFVNFDIRLGVLSTQKVTLNFELKEIDGEHGAREGGDFSFPTGGVITIPSGNNAATLSVEVLHDTLDEHDEVFEVRFFGLNNAAFDSGQADLRVQGTIIDNDRVPELKFASGTFWADEGDPLNFVIELSEISGRSVTAKYHTVDGTAEYPDDYAGVDESAATTLTIPAGDLSVTIPIATVSDALVEGNESMELLLSASDDPLNPTWASLSDPTAEGIITESVSLPELSVTYPLDSAGEPIPVVEGNDLIFTVHLEGNAGEDVLVRFETVSSDDSNAADAGDDYVSTFLTNLIIEPGIGSIEVPVATIVDGVTESTPETVAVRISLESASAHLATIKDEDATAIGAIVDALITVGFQLDASNQVEVLEGEAFSYVIALSQAIGQELSVPLHTRRLHVPEGAVPGSPGDLGADYLHVDASHPLLAVIPAGQTSATVTVPTFQDNISEVNERFVARLSAPSLDGVWVDPSAATSVIIDDDATPVLSVAANPRSIDEDAVVAIVEFTASLSGVSSRAIQVGYEISGAGAFEGVDFEMLDSRSSSGTLTFAPGQTSRTVRVQVIDDARAEADPQVIRFELQPPVLPALAAILGTTSSAETEIIDDEVAVSIGPSNLNVDEGDTAEFTVELSRALPTDVSVQYYTQSPQEGPSASPGTDYDAVSPDPPGPGTVTIVAGATSATISVATTQDDVHEPDEEFGVHLVSPQPLHDSLVVADRTATAVIVDDEEDPQVSIAATQAEVAESEQAAFTLSLSGPSSSDISVDYETLDGTAEAPRDYVAVSRRTATFHPGETELSLLVDTVGDSVPEDDEEFSVVLSNVQPSGSVTLGTSQATVTIRDDDLAVSLEPSLVEGDEGDVLQFTVRLTAPAPDPITVEYFTSAVAGASPASPDVDFAHVPETSPGSVVVPTGGETATISISTLDDAVHEPDEEFRVELVSPQPDIRLSVRSGAATGRIVDDESVPEATVTAQPDTIAEGETAVFILELSGPSSQDIAIDYVTEGGTATDPADFTGASSWTTTPATATFVAGLTQFTLRIPTVDDVLPEDDETFELVISSPVPSTAAVLGDARAEVTIEDDDVSVGFVTSPTLVDEDAGTVDLVVELREAMSTDVLVDYFTQDVVNVPATAGVDYDAVPSLTPRTVTIAAGNTSATISLGIFDDAIFEGAEEFGVTLTNPRLAVPSPGVSIALDRSRAIVQITDDEASPRLNVVAGAPVEEGSPLTFTVSLDTPASQAISVDYAISDGTAEAPADYLEVLPGTITFAPGDTTAQVVVTTRDDLEREDDETIRIDLSSVKPAGVVVEESVTAFGTILANDGCVETGEPAPPLIATPPVVREDATTAVFRFELPRPFCESTTINVSTSAGTALPDDDYTTVDQEVVLAAEQETFTVDVPLVDDAVGEADETFVLSLVYDAAPWESATATIIDDDQPEINIGDALAREGEDATFLVTLSNSSAIAVEVDYSTSDIVGGAVGAPVIGTGADYETASGSLTFAPGTTAQTLSVPTYVDAVDEVAERFEVDLSNPVNASITDSMGIGTIIDADCVVHTDPSEPLITMNVPTELDVDEGILGTDGIVPVTFSARPCIGDLGYTVTAEAHGSAIGTTASTFDPNDDFRIVTETKQFPLDAPGNTRHEYSAAWIHDDELPEAFDETFQINIAWSADVPTHYQLQPVRHTIVSIQDDDRATVDVKDAQIFEGRPITFEFTLSKAADADVIVHYKTQRDATGEHPANHSDTSEESQDYIPKNGTIVIPAGETIGYVNVDTIRDDNPIQTEDEALVETFLMTIDSVENATVGDRTAVGKIHYVGECMRYEDIVIIPGLVGVTPWATGLPVEIPLRIPENWQERFGGNIQGYGMSVPYRVCEPVTYMIRVLSDSSTTATVREHGANEIVDGTVFTNYPSADLAWSDRLTFLVLLKGFRPHANHDFWTLGINDDDLYEGEETGKFRIWQEFTHAGEHHSYSFTSPFVIVDNDPPPEVEIADAYVKEGNAAKVTLALSEPSGVKTTVNVVVAAHSSGGEAAATEGVDFEEVQSISVVIPAGRTSRTIAIQTIDDSILEVDETFLVLIADASGATIADQVGVVTILDDESCLTPTEQGDDAAELSIEDAVVNESSGTVRLTVSHPRFCSTAQAIRYGTSAGTSDTAAPSVDYESLTTTSVDLDGAHFEFEIDVRIIDDDIYEGTETFTVWAEWGSTMPQAYQSASRTSATVSIENDDSPPLVSIATASNIYGEPLNFAATLTDARGRPVITELPTNISWETRVDSSGSNPATEGTDYVAVTNGMLTIPAGNSTGTLTVQTLASGESLAKTLLVAITNVENATIEDSIAVGTVDDCIDRNNGPIQELRVSRNGLSVHEDGRIRFKLQVSRHFCQVSHVWFRYVGVSPDPAGNDDAPVLGPALFTGKLAPPFIGGFIGRGEELELTFNPTDDNRVEGDENFEFHYGWYTPMPARYTDLTFPPVPGTILDDDD